jgi:hypothetical protein
MVIRFLGVPGDYKFTVWQVDEAVKVCSFKRTRYDLIGQHPFFYVSGKVINEYWLRE